MTTSRKEKILEDTQTHTHTGALESLISAAQKLLLRAKISAPTSASNHSTGVRVNRLILSPAVSRMDVFTLFAAETCLLQAASWRGSQMLLKNRTGNLLPDPSMQQKGKKNVCVCFFKQGCSDSRLRQPAVKSEMQGLAEQQTGRAVWLDED